MYRKNKQYYSLPSHAWASYIVIQDKEVEHPAFGVLDLIFLAVLQILSILRAFKVNKLIQ